MLLVSLLNRTSDDELLPVDARVSFGALQQSDPVVHLLGRVGVAVQHPLRSDDDKRVGSNFNRTSLQSDSHQIWEFDRV